MVFFNIVSYVLVLIGAFNWGMFGIFDFNLVSWIFGGPRSTGAIIIYVLVALAALWLIISPIVTGWGLMLSGKARSKGENKPVAENN
ncbi:MAG: DUF378 domain-containing protein [Clostridia bacterium]|nr:DUF378 domain-containing protein [Clostridia bacterium]